MTEQPPWDPFNQPAPPPYQGQPPDQGQPFRFTLDSGFGPQTGQWQVSS